MIMHNFDKEVHIYAFIQSRFENQKDVNGARLKRHSKAGPKAKIK